MELSHKQIDIIKTNATDILDFLDDIKETIQNGQYISIANKLKQIYDSVNYEEETDEEETDDEETDDDYINDEEVYTLTYLDKYMVKYNQLIKKVPEHLRDTKYNIFNNRNIFKIRDCYCSLGQVCDYQNQNHIYCSNYINFLLDNPLMIILELYISNQPETEDNIKLYLNEYNLYFGHKYNEDYYSFIINNNNIQYCVVKTVETMKVYLTTCEMLSSQNNDKISKSIIAFYGVYSVLSNYCKNFLNEYKKYNFACYKKLIEFKFSDDINFIKKAGEYINLPTNTFDKALDNYNSFIFDNHNIMDILGEL